MRTISKLLAGSALWGCLCLAQVSNPGAQISGTPTTSHCASWFNSTTLQDAGASCGGAGGSPGGSSGNVQYNNGGAFGGATGLSFSTGALSLVNASTGFQIGGAAASGHYLRGNGTNYVDSTIQGADVPTLNQSTTLGAWTGTYTPASGKVLGGATPAAVTVTSSYVDNSIALTGTDINTSNQVTATHLAAALPVLQGGTGLTAGTAGKVLGGATPSYVTLTSGYVDTSICSNAGCSQNTTGTASNLSGTPALPNGTTATTQTALDSSTNLGTTAYADAAVGVEKTRAQAAEALLAPLASPALTGNPTAPTQTAGTNNTTLATMAALQTGIGAVTGFQKASEPATPVQAQGGLDTTYLNVWTVPGTVDNATTPNLLYSTLHYGNDDETANLYTLQQTRKCLASIENATSGSFCAFVWVGDSDISGVSATTSPIIQLNNRMQLATTGWGYAGPGFLSVGSAKNVMPTGVVLTLSGSWSSCAWTNGTITNGHSGACWGPDAQDTQDSASGDYVQWATSGTTTVTDWLFYYAKQAGGGSFQPSIDASNCGSAISTNGSGIGSVHCTSTSATHTAKLAITTSGSPVDILGAIAIDSTHNGIVTLRFAAAATEAANFALNPNWNALMAQVQSDLSGMSGFATGVTLWGQEWGANEWGDNHTPASLLTAMTTLNTGFTSSGSAADYLVMTDNDDGNGGTTNTLTATCPPAGCTMWQYDYAINQFALKYGYAFFSVFRNTYPARSSLCSTLHLASVPCQRMISTVLLDRMTGHIINDAALNPMTTLGDFVYGGAQGVATRLAGNTAATDQVLTSTGTGSAGQAPTLKNAPALSAANMTSLNATNVSSGTLANARVNDSWANGITNFANVVYDGNTTITFINGTTSDVTVNVDLPTVATAYQAYFSAAQTTVDSGCGTHGGLQLQLSWTDQFSGTAITGVTNVGTRTAALTTWTTAAAATMTAAGSLTNATVYYGLSDVPIYNQANAQVSFTLHVVTQNSCTTPPVFKVHARFVK